MFWIWSHSIGLKDFFSWFVWILLYLPALWVWMPPLVSFSFRVRLAIVYFYAFTGLGSDLLSLGLFLTPKTQLKMDSKEFVCWWLYVTFGLCLCTIFILLKLGKVKDAIACERYCVVFFFSLYIYFKDILNSTLMCTIYGRFLKKLVIGL